MKKLFILLLIILLIPIKVHAKSLDLSEVSLNSTYVTITQVDAQGKVSDVYSRNGSVKMYPASMTKMITIYTALNLVDDLNQSVTITSEDLDGLAEAGASVAGLKVGDTLPFIDLLYASMLASGADASNAIARVSAGSTENLVIEINKMAQANGMTNSKFANVTGLFNEDNYTTTDDLAHFMSIALQNETFKEVLSAKQHLTPPIASNQNGLVVNSTIFGYLPQDDNDLGYITGGKTGWVPESQYTFASFADYLGRTYIIVSGEAYERGTSIIDHKNLYHYLFDTKETIEVIAKDEILEQIPIKYGGKVKVYDVKQPEAITMDLPIVIDKEDLVLVTHFIESAKAPIKKGQPIGHFEITSDNQVLLSHEVTFDQDISRNWIIFIFSKLSDILRTYTKEIIIGSVALIATLSILIISYRKFKKRKRQRSSYKGYRL